MGFFSNFFQRKNINQLTQHDRIKIFSMLGSFDANKLALNGNDMIANSYERNVDVYAVIKKIVDISKSVPWIVEQKQSNGNWKELKDTSIHELMEQPNTIKGYTWNDIEEQMLTYLLVTGNAYIVGEKPLGMNGIAEIDVLPSKLVEIRSNESFFNPIKEYYFNIGSSSRTFKNDEIGHIKFFNPAYNSVLESHYGLSLIKVAAQVVQVGNDRWDANANIFQNRGAVGLITDKSVRPMSPEEADKVQSAWNRDTAGTGNFGKIKVTNKDLNYIQMAMTPSDLQLVESGVVNLRAICNVFGLDSSLFNDPANKTYNNANEAQKALYTNAIIPLSDKIAEHLTRFIAANHFPDKKVRIRQDFSQIPILQENLKEKADVVMKLKNSGIITANEARVKLGESVINNDNANELVINTTLLNDINNNQNNVF